MSEVMHYTYTLAYPDGTVFYIGKGSCGTSGYDRIDEHENQARRMNGSAPSRKCSIIREIWSQGGQVLKRKLYETTSKEDALFYERALITFMNATGELSNIQNSEGFHPTLVHFNVTLFREILVESQLSSRTLCLLSGVTYPTMRNAKRGKAIQEASAAKILSALSNQLGRKIKQKDITDLKLS